MNDASPDRHDKFRAYRERKKAKGLREVRLWLPDTRTPEFQEALRKQAEVIRASEEDRRAAEDMQDLSDEVWTKTS